MTEAAAPAGLLTGHQVCQLLHISPSTRWDWTVTGRLEAIRHHARGRYYYPAQQPVIAAVAGAR